MTMRRLAAALLALAAAGCGARQPMPRQRLDPHSWANHDQVRTTHLDLDLEVRFERKTLAGTAGFQLARKGGAPLILDTRGLRIHKVEAGEKSQQGEARLAPAHFRLGAEDPILGAPLEIELPRGATYVRIHYETSPEASGLKWLEPEQTAGKRRPFLYTQSQAIHARSWVPVQDTPGVRFTYRARIRTPKDLIALMSARSDFRLSNRKEPPSGDYTFRMPQAIPAYLLALAVGEVEFRYLSSRTGVWAELPVLDRAAQEFVDIERMVQAAERLLGPYLWRRYDILVLPPSFPYGGMENPLMTFVTPTILAGDKSLVSLLAHELAHSWTGNLVTNATWNDFWLNEGFTVYFERRILEEVYGLERARMEAALGRQSLEEELKRLPESDQLLEIDLRGRDPDAGLTEVPYEKGALFLLALEETFGRERFDAFLRAYLQRFAFESVSSRQFRQFLTRNLLAQDPATAAKVPVEEWLSRPGLPTSAPKPQSQAFQAPAQLAALWKAGSPARQNKIRTQDWNTQQWLYFLRSLPSPLERKTMQQLDQHYNFTRTGNAEILFEWLRMVVRSNYQPAFAKLEEFLLSVGRRKFVKPLYEELVKTAQGRKRAQDIFAKARVTYHPITAASIEALLNPRPAQ